MGSKHVDQYHPGVLYSTRTAFIYLFNLVMGTGVLALPSILVKGGWILGSAFLILVSYLSYISATFVIEAMAAGNALLVLQKPKESSYTGSEEDGSHELESRQSEDPFHISRRVEFSKMAELFFNRTGQIFFYIAFIAYLYSSSTIFVTFSATSILRIAFNDVPVPGWGYDACLAVFAVCMIPLCLYDFQKTKYLQMFAVVFRQLAVILMVILAAVSVATEGPHIQGVQLANFWEFPNLVGGAVFSFMCHHSMPGIITPMEKKEQERTVVWTTFLSVCSFYLLLFLSTAAAFGLQVSSPITFNFPSDKYGLFGYFILLFPVATGASNFPMVCITLRNNMMSLVHGIALARMQKRVAMRQVSMSNESAAALLNPADGDDMTAGISRTTQNLVALLACVPPLIFPSIAFHAGIDIDDLVGVTGSYAGCAVMFVIPACLVYASRKKVGEMVPGATSPHGAHPRNMMASPYRSQAWPLVILAWSALIIIFVTIHRIVLWAM